MGHRELGGRDTKGGSLEGFQILRKEEQAEATVGSKGEPPRQGWARSYFIAATWGNSQSASKDIKTRS